MKEEPIRLVSGLKLPSKITLVSVGAKMVMRVLSEGSGHVDGGGAAGKILHHFRKENGTAGLR